MKRILLLSSISLLSAVCAFAQYDSKPSDTSTQSSTTTTTQSSTSDTKTIQGCLSGSDGNYTLTDKSATVKLTGDTSKLQAHVGHTIQVTGTLASSSASATSTDSTGQKTSSMSGSADAQQPTFTVASFKHVSPTCATQ
jgi:hypothetical protein